RPEIVLAGDREAGLDDVDAEGVELAGHADLLLEVHAATGRLLAVAQRRVEDGDPVGHLGLLTPGGVFSYTGRNTGCQPDSGRFDSQAPHRATRPTPPYFARRSSRTLTPMGNIHY